MHLESIDFLQVARLSWGQKKCLDDCKMCSVRVARDTIGGSDHCETRARNTCVCCAGCDANKLSAKRACSAELAAILINARCLTSLRLCTRLQRDHFHVEYSSRIAEHVSFTAKLTCWQKLSTI